MAKVGKKTKDAIQFGALPFSIGEDGQVRVMLLTSRETKRWVIPKGWPMQKRKPHQVAMQEAYEEAGFVGNIVGKRPVGSYHYTKQLTLNEPLLCQVVVYLMRVERQMDEWPEKEQRQTQWFAQAEAAALVDEGGLAEIIKRTVPA